MRAVFSDRAPNRAGCHPRRLPGILDSLLHLIFALALALLTCALPQQAQALETLEARWSPGEGHSEVQFEYRDGLYVARILDDVPECGLAVCDAVFRGTLDKDGILTGESRYCAGQGCQRGASWKFAMGRLSRDANSLSLFGAPIQISRCASSRKAASGEQTLVRGRFDRVDCEKRRAFAVLTGRIRSGLSEEEARVLLDAVRELSNRYPGDLGDLLLLQGRIFAAQGSELSAAQARASFEKAIKNYGAVRGQCELAILEAQFPQPSKESAPSGRAHHGRRGAQVSSVTPGKRLLLCNRERALTCSELSSARLEVLRSQKEFWDLWKRLNCESN